jgi:hypothetical protein
VLKLLTPDTETDLLSSKLADKENSEESLHRFEIQKLGVDVKPLETMKARDLDHSLDFDKESLISIRPEAEKNEETNGEEFAKYNEFE